MCYFAACRLAVSFPSCCFQADHKWLRNMQCMQIICENPGFQRLCSRTSFFQTILLHIPRLKVLKRFHFARYCSNIWLAWPTSDILRSGNFARWESLQTENSPAQAALNRKTSEDHGDCGDHNWWFVTTSRRNDCWSVNSWKRVFNI